MYREEYYYKSGVNQTMRAALADVVESAQRYTSLTDHDVVIDIGSNDGTLLSNYTKGYKIGFEPSNVAQDCPVYYRFHTYFSEREFHREFKGAVAKIITACAMFYDLDDPLTFLIDARDCLADDGVLVIQMNYIKTMVDNCNFDNISHEHLCYYSIKDMVGLLARASLYIEDAELNNVNGGSIRFYIRKQDTKPQGQSDRYVQLKEKERIWYEELDIAQRLSGMELEARIIAHELHNTIEGKRACAIGASTRGYVILQFAGLELPLIERNAEKVGKTLGNMPILSEESIDDYEIGIILPYHFADEMQERYKKNKISLLVPIPQVKLLESALSE
jgi:hypothetical protein